MTLTFDPSGDFAAVADGVEAVTLTSPSGTATNVTSALRRALSEREARESNGRYTRQDVVWHVPRTQVAAPPAVGATVTDASGQRFVVLQVDRETLSDRWQLWSRRLAVAVNLTDRVLLQEATWGKDAQGAAAATWKLVRANIPARVQPMEGVLAEENDRPALLVTHRIYLGEGATIRSNSRVVQATTQQAFRIVRYRYPERLDELLTLEVQKVPA